MQCRRMQLLAVQTNYKFRRLNNKVTSNIILQFLFLSFSLLEKLRNVNFDATHSKNGRTIKKKTIQLLYQGKLLKDSTAI